mgnify:FL=1
MSWKDTIKKQDKEMLRQQLAQHMQDLVKVAYDSNEEEALLDKIAQVSQQLKNME